MDEFSRWAEDIGELDGLSISKLTYNPISFEKMKEVSRGEHVANTWILGLKFFVNRIAQYSFVFTLRGMTRVWYWRIEILKKAK